MLLVGLAIGGWAGAETQAADGEAPVHLVPRGQDELPTTSARIYLHNLALEREDLEAAVARRPDAVWALQQLAGIDRLEGGYRGDLTQVARGIERLDRCVRQLPAEPSLRLARARMRMTLHRFPQAAEDLEAARATLGAAAEKSPSFREVEIDLWWNLGDYGRAIPAIRDAAERRPGSGTLARLAHLEIALGHPAEAERLFAAAEGLIDDIDPLPVAWLNVQRGVHQLERQDYAAAERFFAEARRRLPGYVLAEEHLAETFRLQGREAEAITLYEEILERFHDPEFQVALAALHSAAGRAAEADRLLAEARRRFEELLARLPEAMYGHAAEFYLTAGVDPARALDLLRRNHALRPNVESYAALARAQLTTGDLPAARETARKALALPVTSAAFEALLREPPLADLRPASDRPVSGGAP